MYNLSEEQIASVEGLIAKLESSLIKARIEKWLAEIEPTGRASSEQMEQFVSFATHLPKELQNFPQSFAHTVKNAPETSKREAKQDMTETAELNSLVDESIADVPDINAPENEEETLHTLGKKTKKQKAVKKGATKTFSKSQKTDAQAKKEDDIIKRNQQVEDKAKVEKQPVKTVIVEKHK